MNELTESKLLNQLDDQTVELSNLIQSYRRTNNPQTKQYIAAKMMTRSTQFNVRAGHLGTSVTEEYYARH